MRYWWVNQNQTYRQEIDGGYLWSPKRKADRSRNPFYETMREVAPGDLVFSFVDTRIAAIGVARGYCYESPKPAEFGSSGANWELIGWRVDVTFHRLQRRVRPKDEMARLRPVLPTRYAPLLASGDGKQAVYLTELPEAFVHVLATLIGPEALAFLVPEPGGLDPRGTTDDAPDAQQAWEDQQEAQVREDAQLGPTEKQELVLARRGQGVYRRRLLRIEGNCRVTGVGAPEFLVASHIKPWRAGTNAERLDGHNGLLLTPSVDRAFDRGFISFEDNGDLIVSPVAHVDALERMGISVARAVNVGSFSSRQRTYLEYHRSDVLRRVGPATRSRKHAGSS